MSHSLGRASARDRATVRSGGWRIAAKVAGIGRTDESRRAIWSTPPAHVCTPSDIARTHCADEGEMRMSNINQRVVYIDE